jgi:hypothetical protein
MRQHGRFSRDEMQPARADAAESARRRKARRRCRKATAPPGTSEVLRGTQGRNRSRVSEARTRRTSTRGRSASAPSCRGRRRPTARRPASETEGTCAGTHGYSRGTPGVLTGTRGYSRVLQGRKVPARVLTGYSRALPLIPSLAYPASRLILTSDHPAQHAGVARLRACVAERVALLAAQGRRDRSLPLWSEAVGAHGWSSTVRPAYVMCA